MRFTFKLSHKAFILVAVPLLFEVIFLSTIAGLLYQVEQENIREAHARDVEAAANSLLQLLLQGGTASVISRLTNRDDFDKQYRLLSDKINAKSLKFGELVKNNPHEYEAFKRMRALTLELQQDIGNAHVALSQNNQLQAMRVWLTVNKKMNAMFMASDELVEEQQVIQQEKARAAQKSREQLKYVIAGGVALNILIAISLAVYFNRGTSRRMASLVDNSMRLARKMPLIPPVGGGDEIAQVDEAFHQMERALSLASHKERAIITNAVDVICSMGADFKITAINPASSTAWGYKPDALIGQRLLSFISSQDIDQVTVAVRRIITDGTDGTFETRFRKSDGAFADMLWSAHWSKDENSLFCVAHDISERKEIDRLKRDFVAMVSHDLRTPLTSVQGFLSLLSVDAYGSLSESGKQSLQLTESSVTRLISLVNDLLDIEKMESGMLSLQVESCSVDEIFKRSIESVKTIAEQKAISIESSVHSEPEVKADRDRITQVVVNLLGNAIKFSPEGSKVFLSSKDTDGSVEIDVRDFGRGVPTEMTQSIFNRFKQVEFIDEKKKGGSGLGLAISKAIVECHGGSIGVESFEATMVSPDQGGSRFWFRLPNVVSGQLTAGKRDFLHG
jgi:PAS domain S-box-containing protein